MVFNSFNFWLIFPFIFVLYWAIPSKFNRVRNGFLLLVSYLLYMNFNAAYLLSETTNGSNLPVTFKVGEQEGKPVYHTFETSSELALFYNSLVAHINSCVKKGWGEKDSVDYESIINSIKK